MFSSSLQQSAFVPVTRAVLASAPGEEGERQEEKNPAASSWTSLDLHQISAKLPCSFGEEGVQLFALFTCSFTVLVLE